MSSLYRYREIFIITKTLTFILSFALDLSDRELLSFFVKRTNENGAGLLLISPDFWSVGFNEVCVKQTNTDHVMQRLKILAGSCNTGRSLKFFSDKNLWLATWSLQLTKSFEFKVWNVTLTKKSYIDKIISNVFVPARLQVTIANQKNLYCKYALPLGFRRQVIPSTERLNIIACTGCNLIQKQITWFTGLTYLVSAAHE